MGGAGVRQGWDRDEARAGQGGREVEPGEESRSLGLWLLLLRVFSVQNTTELKSGLKVWIGLGALGFSTPGSASGSWALWTHLEQLDALGHPGLMSRGRACALWAPGIHKQYTHTHYSHTHTHTHKHSSPQTCF